MGIIDGASVLGAESEQAPLVRCPGAWALPLASCRHGSTSLSSVLPDPSPIKTDARTEPSSVFRILLARVVAHVRCFSRPRCSHPIFHLPPRCLSVVQPAAPPVHRPAKFMVKWFTAVLFHSSPPLLLSVRSSTWRYPEQRSEAVRPSCRPCSTHACMHVGREREIEEGKALRGAVAVVLPLRYKY